MSTTSISYRLSNDSTDEPDIGDWLLTAAGSAYEILNVVPSDRVERLFRLEVRKHGPGWSPWKLAQRGVTSHFTMRWGSSR